MKKSYLKTVSLEHRRNEVQRIRQKYPDKIPVILEKREGGDIPDIDKNKYLVPLDLTVGQFVYIVRKRLKLKPEQAIFVFINNILPPFSKMMKEVYDEYKEESGFLYITYSTENTFG